MDGWNTIVSFWGPTYFQVLLLLVLGSVFFPFFSCNKRFGSLGLPVPRLWCSAMFWDVFSTLSLNKNVRIFLINVMKGPWCCGVSYSTCWQEVTVDRKHIICNCSQESQLQRHLLQLLNCHELAAHLGAFALLHWCRNMSRWKASWIQNNQGQLLYSFKAWWMLDVRYGPEACKICFWNIETYLNQNNWSCCKTGKISCKICRSNQYRFHFSVTSWEDLGGRLIPSREWDPKNPRIHQSPNLQTHSAASEKKKNEWRPKVKPTQCARWRWTCEWIASYLKQKIIKSFNPVKNSWKYQMQTEPAEI